MNETGHREVTVQQRMWQRMRKPALLSGAGLVALGLLAGLFAHEHVKNGGTTMATSREAVAADRVVVLPPIDDSQPKVFETATFALG